MDNIKSQAFTEIYEIINHMDEKLYKKIPKKFINLIAENRDKSYKVKFNYNENISSQNILHETKIILSIIYRDYICSPEEREKIKQLDKKQIEEEQKALYEKYKFDWDKVNNNRNKLKESSPVESSNLPLNIEKESFIKRIFNWFKKLFRNKK